MYEEVGNSPFLFSFLSFPLSQGRTRGGKSEQEEKERKARRKNPVRGGAIKRERQRQRARNG